MKIKFIAILLLSFIYLNSFSQNTSIEDAYLNYKVGRNVKGNTKSIASLAALLTRANELSTKQVANIEYHLGRIWEM